MKPWAKQTGFTIVELLIVIVVIAILAAITIVAYNGIQARSRDASRDAAANSIKKGLELYRTQNDTYPAPVGCINAGCNLSNLASYLVPTYVSTIPDDPQAPAKPFKYVTDATATGYGIYVQYYETKPQCKYLGGTTPNAGWWGIGIPAC